MRNCACEEIVLVRILQKGKFYEGTMWTRVVFSYSDSIYYASACAPRTYLGKYICYRRIGNITTYFFETRDGKEKQYFLRDDLKDAFYEIAGPEESSPDDIFFLEV